MAENTEKATPGILEQLSELSPGEEAYFETGGESDPAATDPGAAIPAPSENKRQREQAPVAEAAAEAEKQRMVPHEALHEERTRRQSADKELAAERENMRVLTARTQVILDRLTAPAPEVEVPLPTLDKDPLGHVMGLLKKQGTSLEQLQQQDKTVKESNQRISAAQREINEISTDAVTQEAAFAADTPDYQEASNFLVNWRHKELI
jgi:hypothetical protein